MKENRYFGNKAFYAKVLAIALPVMLQNGITQFVSLLDNIMVGQTGTMAMSGVAVVNQLLFVFNVTLFGALSGASIFGAQFYGSGNQEGFRSTFRFKLVMSAAILAVGTAAFLAGGRAMIGLFLEGESADAAATLAFGRAYLSAMLWGLLPYALTQTYASTLREMGEALVPMYAGVAAVLVNLAGNYLLIFGKLGCPALGVVGAAIATDIARVVECVILLLWAHRNTDRCSFAVGVLRHFHIPADLAWKIFKQGLPLMLNELLWSVSVSTIMQCYSTRGLAVVAAFNIEETLNNLFVIVFMATSTAISVMVGQQLGAGETEQAVDTARKLIVFTMLCCAVVSVFMAGLGVAFPGLYNTDAAVRTLATRMIWISASFLPFHAFMYSTYFILRSGGKSLVTFAFDSGFAWVVQVPLAWVLSRYTDMAILPLFFCCTMVGFLKCIAGYILVKKRVWVHNLVG